ncbi:MAG TPA: serine/threonine-protein kinase [Pirellulales bacterium]|jgi:serine/threonine-protein kinase|nr:serine/threonine-protein kinase [Pirellulales bacterium]
MTDDFSTPAYPTSQSSRAQRAGSERSGTSLGFTPTAAIAYLGQGNSAAEEYRTVVRVRLGELAVIYALLFGMVLVLRPLLLGLTDPPVATLTSVVAVLLVGAAALVAWRPAIKIEWLRAIELAMTAALAGVLVLYHYRRLIERSLAADPVTAQLVEKNAVLLFAMLILFHGIYVPKSWRRAAAVGVPLALMTLSTVVVGYLTHRDALGWVAEWQNRRIIPLVSFGLDTLFLLLLAAVAASGAHMFSRLRNQLAEARYFGQYRLKRQIGSGGMGDVYLAEHQLLKRACAVKLIRASSGLDPRALARFEREVRITATLSHPNTVEIFDYGRTEDGTYYYVMEYLPGLSLADLVEQYGPLPPERVVYLLRQVCHALREAHGADLIHRDIKPSNIFAARRGGQDDVAKLLDFGLVRPLEPVASAEQSAVGPIGTPAFMSPEQVMGESEVDARSDIYSLGAVAYYLLTGRPPFQQRSGIGTLIAQVRDPVTPLTQLRADVPADLERVVLWCLAKQPVERPADVDVLERALGQCACAADWDQRRASAWWHDSLDSQPTAIRSERCSK